MLTVKQAAAIAVVTQEVEWRGRCTLSHTEVARRAKVGRTTVRAAILSAVSSGMIVIRRRSAEGETNIIEAGPAVTRQAGDSPNAVGG